MTLVELSLVVVPQLVAIGAAYGGVVAKLDALKESTKEAADSAKAAHRRIDNHLESEAHA